MVRAKHIVAASGASCALAALFLAGCAISGGGGAAVAPPVTPALVAASHGVPTGTLEQGRGVFLGACTSCHAPDPISKYSAARWEEIVGEMAPKAKLNPDRRAALLAYLRGAKALTAAR